MARKTKLSDELIQEIALDVEKGIPLSAAAEARGFSRKTAYFWEQSGKTARSGVYRRFYEALTIARARRVATLAESVMHRARHGDVAAALRLLQLWEPSEFDKPERLQIEGGDSQTAEKLPDEFLGSLSEFELFALETASRRLEHWRQSGGDPARYTAAVASDNELLGQLAKLERLWQPERDLWKQVAKTGRQAAQKG